MTPDTDLVPGPGAAPPTVRPEPVEGRRDDAERLAQGFAEHVVRWAKRVGRDRLATLRAQAARPGLVEGRSSTVRPEPVEGPAREEVVIPDSIRDPSNRATSPSEPDESALQILRRCAYEVSLATSNGHVCIMLSDLTVPSSPDVTLSPSAGFSPSPTGGGQGWGQGATPDATTASADVATLRTTLLSTPVVGTPETPGACPLVLDADNRLYLHRYFNYELRLARRLMQAASTPPRTIDAATRDRLNTLFQSSDGNEVDWQKIAAAMALRNGLTVISGGPGTGKTTTVVNLIACLLTQDPYSRIALAAPTGKAAARMTEAIAQRADHLPADLRSKLPQESFTIHRLLGANPGLGKFTHHAGNPLPYDALIVDEASMLDLAMATRLLEAVPASARIILLGDKDQLSAVESGAVFAELCADPTLTDACRRDVAAMCGYAPERIAPPAPVQPSALRDAAVWLTKNYRFAADSGIGKLANYINEGRAEEAIAWLRERPFALSPSKVLAEKAAPPQPFALSLSKGKRSKAKTVDTASLPLFPELVEQTPLAVSPLKDADPDTSVQWLEPGPGRPSPLDAILAGYAPYFETVLRHPHDVDAITRAFARFRTLCAVREGPSGVSAINDQLTRHARQAVSAVAEGQDTDPRSPWYTGRPVMVLRNDYVLKLFNGDIGIALPDATGELAVFFPDGANGFRSVPAVRMPEHHTGFAMTVHKAQGSEFDTVLVLLPHQGSRVATRELLYTAVTRARSRITLGAGADTLTAAIESRSRRYSGLPARFGEAAEPQA